jgi:hypothetical protein
MPVFISSNSSTKAQAKTDNNTYMVFSLSSLAQKHISQPRADNIKTVRQPLISSNNFEKYFMELG